MFESAGFISTTGLGLGLVLGLTGEFKLIFFCPKD